MSYTNPDGQPQGAARRFTERLREILIAEIDAIRGYEQHIADSNMEEINKAWHAIMLDEKKHYGWILKLLRKYDANENKAFEMHKGISSGPKNPMQIYKPDYEKQIIINNLLNDIKGELEAVILYEDEMLMLPHADIRNVLQNIIQEEKGHAEHLTELVLKYDPDLYNSLD